MDRLDFINARIPLILVFLSGIGFSIQTLIIKLLELDGFHGTFFCVFSRGLCQFLIAIYVVFRNRNVMPMSAMFGSSNWIKWIMFLRAFIGYGGIAFSFLAVEILPIGDASVLVMLSPCFASIFSYFFLGESWRIVELVATSLSLSGAVLVAKPTFIFHSGQLNNSSRSTLGVVYALVSAVSAGIAFNLVRMLGTSAKMPWANVCVAQAIAQMVLAVPCVSIFGQVIRFDMSRFQYALIFAGGFVGAWSQIAMTIGMQREKSASATAMRMSDVVFGFIWQHLFTFDSVNPLSVAGAALVSGSIILIIYFKRPDKTPIASAVNIGTEMIQEDRRRVMISHSIPSFNVFSKGVTLNPPVYSVLLQDDSL
jgi:drug/metabolite transporter (DMT)-like permease